MTMRLAKTAMVLLATAAVATFAEAADKSFMSAPPDTNNYSRPAIPGDFASKKLPQLPLPIFVVDTVVNNTDPNLKNTDTFNDGEINIAVDPLNTNRIVITAFSGGWGATAPLWLSTNGGVTWTKQFTINPPPGVGGVLGYPCDQSVDFGHFTALAGTFLTAGGGHQRLQCPQQ